MDTRELERRTERITLGDLDLKGMFLAFDRLLRQALPYAAAAWSTQDPATGLFTSCTVTGLPKDLEREAQLFRHEHSDGEPATFQSLIADSRTVAILSEITDQHLERAARYRDLLQGYGCTDELRAVLWADGLPWGSVILYRMDGRFDAGNAFQVAAMAPTAARGLQLALLRSAATHPESMEDPPGILQVNSDGQVTAMTAPARRWLDVGGPPLVTAANSVAAAIRQHERWSGATSRLSLPESGMLSLHASMTTGDSGDVAVIVHAARPAEVSAMLVDAYRLTPRQREVLGLLLLGRSLTQIAHQLDISEHTANDHRKAVYSRVGVSSRSQLAALLQADQYDPRAHAGVPPSPYGGFLDA